MKHDVFPDDDTATKTIDANMAHTIKEEIRAQGVVNVETRRSQEDRERSHIPEATHMETVVEDNKNGREMHDDDPSDVIDESGEEQSIHRPRVEHYTNGFPGSGDEGKDASSGNTMLNANG